MKSPLLSGKSEKWATAVPIIKVFSEASMDAESLRSYRSVSEIYHKEVDALKSYDGQVPVPSETIQNILAHAVSAAHYKDSNLLGLIGAAFASYFSKTERYDQSRFPGSLEAIRTQKHLVMTSLVDLQCQHSDVPQITEIGSMLVAASPFCSDEALRRLTFSDNPISRRLTAMTMLYQGALIAERQGTLGTSFYGNPGAYTNLDPHHIYSDFRAVAEEEGKMTRAEVLKRERKIVIDQLTLNWKQIKEDSLRGEILFGVNPLKMLRQSLRLLPPFGGPRAITRRLFQDPAALESVMKCHEDLVKVAIKARGFLADKVAEYFR